MVFYQEVKTCAPDLIDEDAEIKVTAWYKDAITFEPAYFTATQKTLKPGRHHRLHISLNKAQQATAGTYRSTMTIRTDSATMPEITAELAVVVGAKVVVSPNPLVIKASQEKTVAAYLYVAPGEVEAFKITQLELPLHGMKASARQFAGRKIRIRIAGIVPSPAIDGKVIRLSIDALDKPVEIPLRY